MANVVVGLLMVVVAGVFWVQRDYSSEYGGLLPDPVMMLLAACGLVLAALGLARRKVGSSEDAISSLPLAGLARATLILLAWVASLPVLGYLVGGIVFFLIMALMMRTQRPGLKDVALDLAVSVGVVTVFYLAFTQVLVVRLPELSF